MLIYKPEGPLRVNETLESDIMFKLSLRIFLFIFVFISSPVSHAEEKSATSILLFGDSIIAGYGLAKLQKLDHKLETILNEEGYLIKVINGGVSGDTTAVGRNRIKWALEKHNPDIILIALGGNDLLRGYPPQVIKSNVEAMIKTAREKNVFVILSAVEAPLNYGVDYKKQFNAIYTELAEQYSIPLYPFLLKGVFGKTLYMQKDTIHPNEKGIDEIAKGLADYFIKNIKNNQNDE